MGVIKRHPLLVVDCKVSVKTMHVKGLVHSKGSVNACYDYNSYYHPWRHLPFVLVRKGSQQMYMRACVYTHVCADGMCVPTWISAGALCTLELMQRMHVHHLCAIRVHVLVCICVRVCAFVYRHVWAACRRVHLCVCVCVSSPKGTSAGKHGCGDASGRRGLWAGCGGWRGLQAGFEGVGGDSGLVQDPSITSSPCSHQRH